MKKSEFKKLITPWIQEIVKETIINENLLTKIISETVQATLQGSLLINEHKFQKNLNEKKQPSTNINNKVLNERKKRLEEISKNAYNGVNIFENLSKKDEQQVQVSEEVNEKYIEQTGLEYNDPGEDISFLMNIFKNKQ